MLKSRSDVSSKVCFCEKSKLYSKEAKEERNVYKKKSTCTLKLFFVIAFCNEKNISKQSGKEFDQNIGLPEETTGKGNLHNYDVDKLTKEFAKQMQSGTFLTKIVNGV